MTTQIGIKVHYYNQAEEHLILGKKTNNCYNLYSTLINLATMRLNYLPSYKNKRTS